MVMTQYLTLEQQTRLINVEKYTKYLALQNIYDRMLNCTSIGPINQETKNKMKKALYEAETEVLRTL